MLPFAEFRPDAVAVGTGFSDQILNVYPSIIGYDPMPGRAAYSGALPATCRGAIAFQRQTGSWRIVAATLAKLYVLNTTDLTWTEAGTGYTGPDTDEDWSFAVFDGYLYATNANDGLKRLEIEAGTTFSAVSGSPPAARYVDAVESYLVLGGLTDDTSAIAWCDTFDPTNWSTGNADQQSFPDGGPVLAVCGAAKKIIQQIKRRAMIPQPGSSVIFAFEEEANARGTIAPGSVIKVGSDIAYLSENGFMLNDTRIGANKVDKWFFDTASGTRLSSVIGSFDPLRGLLRWAFHTDDATAHDYQLVYNPFVGDGRWAPVVDGITHMVQIATAGLTLAGLAALYATIADMPFPFGSRIWMGGRPTLGVFDSDNKLAFYEGTALAATLETGEDNLIPGYRARVRGCRPIIDGDTGAVTQARLGTRERVAGTVAYGSYGSLGADGHVSIMRDGRYHRVGVSIAAGSTWSHAKGVEIDDYDVSRLGRR